MGLVGRFPLCVPDTWEQGQGRCFSTNEQVSSLPPCLQIVQSQTWVIMQDHAIDPFLSPCYNNIVIRYYRYGFGMSSSPARPEYTLCE